VRKSDNLKTLPFLVGVGAEDFAVRSARGLRDGLQRAEVARVEYKEYPAIEHLLIVQVALKEVFAFFDQCPPR
jgi:alpha-beta hydrolase superfamily lysophospholipase